ncbi:putative uncharacterized protein DDB_G0286901 isoform X2 [Episyrphus balteatus]|uniref:putative uncharacterized protein DDB_G0286901 isoform X2 n=1 Tax=Episyrphus balteatus TaxID=286459 RepID=UPI0024861D8A|nr:putative uncharacterized protein DDB_G0286901 isoform X2 [Episyrphus balteatus]
MAVVRKKQDDKYLKVLRELVASGSGGNRQCFDCGQKGPTYVNMTIGSFVCTRCSGVLRGLTPPHRVKSISMATFTPDEIEFLKSHGNETCAKTWLGLWDPKRAVHQDQRELMIDKYERKRYFLEPASPLKSLPNAAKLTPSSNNNNSSSSLATHSNNNINNNLNNNNTGLSSNGGVGNIQAMNQKNTALDNGFQNISLTPPSSRSNGNGNINGYGPSAISRPNHQQQQQPQQQNGHHHYDAFSNGLNGLSSLTNGNTKLSFNGSSSTANSETSSCNSNGFTPESDFVADFSSATIFDATSTNSVGSSGSGGSSSNGYAKIQSINAAAHMMNGNAVGPLMNGNGKVQNGNGGGGGGFATPTNGNSENFADFDHAPIFNAAEFNSKTTTNIANNLQQQQLKTNNNRNNNNYLFFAPTPNQQQQLLQQQQQQQKQTNFYSNTMFEISNDFNSISLFSGNSSQDNDDLTRNSSLGKNIFNKCSNNTSSMAYNPYNTNNNNGNAPNSSLSSTSYTCNNPYNGQQQKFTPLAMAAHATAMAVLGHNSSSLNSINSPFGIQSSEWGEPDTWQQQQHQDSSITASQQQQQQQWPGLSSVSNNNVNNNNATMSSYNHPLAISVVGGGGGGGVGSASIEADSDPSHQRSNRNSWSLPISNSTTSNSLSSSSATFNSSSSLAASPPADRYAALKDLDEQLRESKAVAAAAAAAVATSVVDSFGDNPNANPFKTVVNSHQTPQIANPFQANPSQQNQGTTNLFGGLPPQNQQQQQHNGLTNGFIGGIPVQQQQQQQAFYNYANGFGVVPQTTNLYSAGPNGCGFGFGTMQQPISNGGGAAFNNPFAATGTLNSNNPFL